MLFSSTIDDMSFHDPVNHVPLYKGGVSQVLKPEDIYFKVGELIKIKFCTIDKYSFSFWNTYQLETINAINPFASSSVNIESNIEGDGLGIWSGQGVTYYLFYINMPH